MKLHLTPTLLTSGPQPHRGGLGWLLAIVESCLNVRALKPRHIFASPRRTPHSFRCPAKCALFLEQSFAPTSACRLQLRLNFVLLSLFLFSSFFYNKLDLRKNRSPFISGGLMVSRRTAHNKNTRLVRRAR